MTVRRSCSRARTARSAASRPASCGWPSARFASALREIGVVAGDRVAAFIPNIPEAVVAALGAAAVGAVWSSCSPDFGVQGVLDRFGQIEPKVLVTADGYFYGGKAHDSLARVRQVLDSLPSVDQNGRGALRRRVAAAGRPARRRAVERVRRRRRAASCASSSCRSTIRSTSSTRRARPACPSASCTAPAAR